MNSPDLDDGCALVIDPNNHNVIYAGCGLGIFKSTDGGSSWTKLNTSFSSDVLEKEVATLVDEELPMDQHKVNWNVQDLASGIHIYL